MPGRLSTALWAGRTAPRFLLVSTLMPRTIPGFRGLVRHDRDAREVYAESAGILRCLPMGVVVPADAEDLQTLCLWGLSEGVPLIARGSGSSMSGAAVGPGVIVDLHRLRQAPQVSAAWGRLVTGASVTRADADRAARAAGWRFPVDPSSGAFATVGGMAGTNAAGPRSLAFGAMRHWVRGIECVFLDGSRHWVRRGGVLPPNGAAGAFTAAMESLRQRAGQIPRRGVRKESSGYGVHEFAATGSLVDLLVGSEGTLAFFTQLELDLLPLPAATATVLGSWPRSADLTHGATLAREAGAVACELLDETFLRVAARGRSLPVPVDSGGVLLVELEGGSAADVMERARALERAWERAGASDVLLGLDPESEDALWALRHAASPILSRLDPHIRSMQVIEDGCVPPHRLGEYLLGVKAALASRGLDGVLFGHAGDAHVHVNALVDTRQVSWRDSVRGLFEDVATLTLALGGTMAGEHGDGRLRDSTLGRSWGEDAMELFRDIRALFDPEGRLNPGVKTGTTTDPFPAIKYDPDHPLGAPAREALDRVEAQRAYDTLRLELLDRTG